MLNPTEDRVVVEIEDEQLSSVVQTVTKSNRDRGTVIAVGPGAMKLDGTRRPMGVKAGDKVLLGDRGQKLEAGGKDLVLVRESTILAVLED